MILYYYKIDTIKLNTVKSFILGIEKNVIPRIMLYRLSVIEVKNKMLLYYYISREMLYKNVMSIVYLPRAA